MLSFMRDQGASGASGNPKRGSGQRAGNAAGEGAQEYLTVATNRSKLRKSTVLVVILVAIGLVCLWFMIRKTQPQAASAQENDEEAVQLESAIGRLTGVSSEMVDKMDEILEKFYEFSDVFQVEVGELVKDPFEVEVFAKDLQNEVVTTNDSAAQAALMRRQRMKEAASTLDFLSVMQSGDGNACMINDKILHQGDTIGGFVIAHIGANSVNLTWQDGGRSGTSGSGTDDLTIQLKLSQ